jgi:hypothetical protein
LLIATGEAPAAQDKKMQTQERAAAFFDPSGLQPMALPVPAIRTETGEQAQGLQTAGFCRET